MSSAPPPDRLQLPPSLRHQILEFRLRVWSVKLAEAVCAALFGLIAASLSLFLTDRVWETPSWVRSVLFAAAWIGSALLPLAVYRWVWRTRRLDQLARLLGRKKPQIGDRLLGVIELVTSESEQARSRALCEAAVAQVAEEAKAHDFLTAVPAPRHRLWLGLLGSSAIISLGLLVACPDAVRNAWRRLLEPWANHPRYTFAALEPLPDTLHVPHGEAFSITARLKPETVWRPPTGLARLGEQPAVTVHLDSGAYAFEFPAQIDPGLLEIRVGDAIQRVQIEPTIRPELTSVLAEIKLPAYLGREASQPKDVRGGSVALVKGTEATIVASASRELSSAEVDGQERQPVGSRVFSPTTHVDGESKLEFRWRDRFGLEGKAPFLLSIQGREDEPPSISCENLPRQRVVLDSESLQFKVRAQDDFGVKTVGMEWQGLEDPTIKAPAKGEKILAAGGHDKEALDLQGTFTATALGIQPQPIQVRIYAEDYLPGRKRVYSPPYTFYVLNAEQHAIWVTEQLSRWHRQSLEVRDREMQLHEANKQLRSLAADELDRPETRRRIENQSQAERANGRRLSNLIGTGEDLVRQAMRNPEFGVGHLEKWAEMLQILKDISANRMPTVADLLKQASQSPLAASTSQKDRTPLAGMVRDPRSGSPSTQKDEAKKAAAVPQVVDRESSQQPLDEGGSQQPPKSSGSPRLTLPVTTLAGNGKGSNACPTGQKMEEAVVKQQDLLAEFEKIADELNRVLANLEGSTLVKRLKAASREQYKIGGRLIDLVGDAFGLANPVGKAGAPKMLDELSQQESKASGQVSIIMDDMHSYFERRRFMQFRTVLDEMRKLDVVGNLRQLGDDLKKENGVSIAQCEYWSDTLDRWADDLVDPTSGGT
jgi:hypothetical protein